MAKQYLDKTGLTYFWSKIKTYVANAVKVTGVKGNSESTYRTGNVNLTLENLTPEYQQGTGDQIMQTRVNYTRANRLAFLPADQIIVEKTTDGGATWTDAGVNDDTKRAVFSGVTQGTIYIPLLNNARSVNCGIRITFTGMKYNVPSGTVETSKYNYWNSNYVASTDRYTTLTRFWFWLGAQSDTIRIKAYRAQGRTPNNWETIFSQNVGFTGWSGSDWLSFGSNTFGGGTGQTDRYWNYRLEFFSRMQDGQSAFTGTNAQAIYAIYGYGESCWTSSNELMKSDHLYVMDANKNATFPAKVTATDGFIGNLTGNATNVTGTVAVANGGTGKTTAVDAANAFANALTTGSSDPTDADYYIAQYAGGGTTTTTYHRRPHSALWNYIKGKISSVLGLTATAYGGTAANASKVSGHSVGVDVPSTAVFTDTVRNKIYTATCTTAAGTAAKVATLEEASGFSLATGVRVAVRFQYGNSATTPTLNVNSSGAKTIAYPTSATAVATGNGSTYNSWGAYETVLFTYNGTYWVKDNTGLLGYLAYNKAEDAKTVAQQAYGAIPAAGTAAILGTGTDTANRTWSAKILHDYIESGVPTTTWTAPTAISSAITVVSGGYYTSGRHCYVQMRCTLTNALSANSGIWAASGLPLPVTGTPPLTIIVNSRGGHACRVNTDGRLQIVADVDHGITAGTTIDIAGVYTIS